MVAAVMTVIASSVNAVAQTIANPNSLMNHFMGFNPYPFKSTLFYCNLLTRRELLHH
jgi:hypothetical protein